MRRCALCLIALLLVGCQCEPAKQAYVQPRSTVFDRIDEPYGVPWFAGRNDQQPGVMAGYESPRVSDTFTWTYDHQGHFGGRVFDHYHQRTYKYSHRQTVQ